MVVLIPTIIIDDQNYLGKLVYENRASKMNFFFVGNEFFNMNFDFKNGCKNEFKVINEKSCS